MDQEPFVLSEEELRALARQLHRQYISPESASGLMVREILRRIQRHVGLEKYDEFVAERPRPK